MGDLRCRGGRSLERWVELVLLAYTLVGLTRWGRQSLGQEPSWGEIQQQWGWSLIPMATEVKGWLANLWRLILWAFQTLSPIPISNLEEEVGWNT